MDEYSPCVIYMKIDMMNKKVELEIELNKSGYGLYPKSLI